MDSIENLLNTDDVLSTNNKNKGDERQLARGFGDDDDDAHLGGIDDDFEIPCTAQTNAPFFSQHGGEFVLQSQNVDTHVPADMELMQQDELGINDISRFDGDNLIQAPLQVNALNIEYAKTSKNIDVRRLKQVIWSLLSNNSDKVIILLLFFKKIK